MGGKSTTRRFRRLRKSTRNPAVYPCWSRTSSCRTANACCAVWTMQWTWLPTRGCVVYGRRGEVRHRSPQSIGHGYDGMQNITNTIVFFSSDFNLEYYEQIIERNGPVRQLQAGHNRKVLIYDLVADDTIDGGSSQAPL